MDDKKRRTKITCTIGPACGDEETLFLMIKAGMDVARFNFSHGTHSEHKVRLDNLRSAAKRAGKRIGIMLDTRGPEIRLGLFKGGRAVLKAGGRFDLVTEEILGHEKRGFVGFSQFPQIVSPGNLVLLDDGNIQLQVREVTDNLVITRILNSGVISDRKKVSVPGSKIEGLCAVSEQDEKDITFGVKNDVDFVAASFIRSSDDVLDVRRVLEGLGSRAHIIAKIESVQGVRALEEILKVSDGLMVARGDLGVEYPAEDVPILQKEMIARANQLGKPVITATQMLESMIVHPRPTRAEASDVANAILDGTDSVMLSGETAFGKYPVESVKFMSRVALKAEKALDHEMFLTKLRGTITNVTEAVSRSVVESAVALRASAIVTPTESGYTARMVSRFRPQIPIFAVTPHERTCGWLTGLWGTAAVTGPKLADMQKPVKAGEVQGDVSDMAIQVLREKGLIKDGALCVVTKGVPQGIEGTTNVMEVRTVGDVVIKGTGIGQNAVSGEVIVVDGDKGVPNPAHQGYVLVAQVFDKTYLPILKRACALILEEQGFTSDGAIAALHLKIPAVVGARDAVRLIKDGDTVTVDGERGVVYRGVARVT